MGGQNSHSVSYGIPTFQEEKKRKHLSHKTVYSVPFTQNLKSFFARKSLTQDLYCQNVDDPFRSDRAKHCRLKCISTRRTCHFPLLCKQRRRLLSPEARETLFGLGPTWSMMLNHAYVSATDTSLSQETLQK